VPLWFQTFQHILQKAKNKYGSVEELINAVNMGVPMPTCGGGNFCAHILLLTQISVRVMTEN
jgi:hypothetical protein